MENYQASADRAIKVTFDMLVDRLSNMEIHIQQLMRSAVFAECCKYGRLNTVALGYPFSIIRRPRYSHTESSPYPSVDGLVVDITVFSNCECHPPPAEDELASPKEVADRMAALFDNADIPQPESRFRHRGDRVIEDLVQIAFENSDFECILLQSGFTTMKFYLSPKATSKAPFNVFLEQIPKVAKALRHRVACINEVEVSNTTPSYVEMTLAIQLAANLPEGPLKRHYLQKADAFDGLLGLGTIGLAMERALVEIDEVLVFLKSKGYVHR